MFVFNKSFLYGVIGGGIGGLVVVVVIVVVLVYFNRVCGKVLENDGVDFFLVLCFEVLFKYVDWNSWIFFMKRI